MAKLKQLVAKIEEVPEQFRELYVKTDDGFALETDGSEFKTKLNEFRENNVKLTKQVESLKGLEEKYKDMPDPKAIRELLKLKESLEKDEEGKLIAEGKTDEVVAKRVKQIETDFQKKIEAVSTEAQTSTERAQKYYGQLKGLKIRSRVEDAFGQIASIRKGANADVLNRAYAMFDIDEEGEVQNKGFYNSKGDLGSIEEWAKSLVDEAPHLFEPSEGSGAPGSKGRSSASAGPKKVDRNDPVAMGKNMDKILSGEVVVDME